MRLLLTFLLSVQSLSGLLAQEVQVTSPRQWQSLHSPFETWTTMTFEAKNFQSQAEDCFLTSYFVDQAQSQYGRRFWLPPQSALQSWYLIKTPPIDETSAKPENLLLNSMLIRQQGGIESAVATDSGERIESNYVRIRKDAHRTLLIADFQDDQTAKFVTAARGDQRTLKDFLAAYEPTFPPVASAYEQWTHIVLASNRVLEDQAGLEALRQWLTSGGKLWILLDKTGADVVAPFLGDAGGLSVVDRVGLTSFEVASLKKEFRVSGKTRELETPVTMVRVVSEGLDPLCEVSGWNAALMARVGSGRLLVTTLDSSGWIRPREEAADMRGSPELAESAYPTRECLSLGESFWGFEEQSPPLELAELATRYVGYQTASLTWVASILAAYCSLALLGAFVLWKTEHLSWLSWFAPLAAVVATAVLGIAGYQNRMAIPPTEASIQIAEADSLGQVRMRGEYSVYSVSDGDTNPEITQGGQLEFSNPPFGVAQRFVGTDFDKAHWENLDLNTGIHELRFQTQRTFPPSQAIVTLNAGGVEGRISGGEWELPERGLIVSPSGQMAAPQFLEEGRFVSTAEDRLSPGQFSASDVIDDREQIRIDLLRKRFAAGQPLPAAPRLYFWTTPLETGIELQAEGRSVGDALVGLPLRFERPDAGSSVYCPDYLISYHSISLPRRGSSMTYSNRDHAWSDFLLRKSTTSLEFQLPPELDRFRLERLRLFVDINAPNRPFQLVALDKDNPLTIQELGQKKSPGGLLEFNLKDDSLPKLNEDLTFALGLDVGPLFDDPTESEQSDPARHGWQIRNLWVEAWGTVLE